MTRIAFIAFLGSALLAGCATTQQAPATNTHVFPLQHIAVGDAAAALEGRAAGATMVADPRTNSLIVQGSPAQLQSVRTELQKIDQPG